MRKYLSIYMLAMLLWCTEAGAQQVVHLWQGTREHAGSVTLTSFLANDASGSHTAVIVCPGGSYSWHDTPTEGIGVARWLQSNGISAFVLNYRVATGFGYASHYRLLFRGHRFPDAFCDVQRAIQYVRQNAQKYGIDPNNVGVMGFSAGGHLAMASGEYFDTDYISCKGVAPAGNLRPDFVVPVYPVVTFTDKRYMHKRSRKGLIGEWHTRKMNDSLSLEHHIKPNTPRVFLVNCKDDPIVKYQNSEILDSALTANHIEHRYIQYKTGGHGFGASTTKGTAECRQWKDEFLRWLTGK